MMKRVVDATDKALLKDGLQIRFVGDDDVSAVRIGDRLPRHVVATLESFWEEEDDAEED